MNRNVFADTFFFAALVNPDDDANKQATELLGSITLAKRRIITTDFNLLELGSMLSSTAYTRGLYANVLDSMNDRHVRVIPASRTLFHQGLQLFRNRTDKQWSVVDCTSFVVMKRHTITDALTGDHHFAQAGFRPLLMK